MRARIDEGESSARDCMYDYVYIDILGQCNKQSLVKVIHCVANLAATHPLGILFNCTHAL
jgi:hypothetical protein